MATAKKALKNDGDTSFAVIATGGKQYRVSVGDTVTIEKLVTASNEALKKGDAVTFEQVLLTDDGSRTVIGAPFIAGAKVTGEVLSATRAQKVTVIKYKQKSRYFKKNGHKQPQLKVTITAIA